jgi:hypothetical protein
VQAWISKKYPQAESVPKKDRILIKERKKCFINFWWHWGLNSGPHASGQAF